MQDEQMLTARVSAPTWAQRSRPAMGSRAEVLVWGPNPEPLADWAMAEIERLEACWSRFRPASDLCSLNKTAGTGPVPVSPLLWDALVAAQHAHAETGGLFDPTVLASLVASGYDRSFPFPPPRTDCSERAAAAPGFAAVELDAINRTVSLPAGCGLDLGGIGKGLTADRIVDGLVDRGAISVCVSMGGDVRVGGPGPDCDGAWEIRVEDPRDDRDAFVFPLLDEALAQSSTLLRRWRHGSREVHHLIDPRTGESSNSGVECVVVTVREAWRAETLAKAALLAGPADGVAMLERAGADGWLLGRSGVVYSTSVVANVSWRGGRRPPTTSQETPCLPR